MSSHTHTRFVRFSFVAYIVLILNIYMALFLLHTVYDTCRHMQQTHIDYKTFNTHNTSNYTQVHVFSSNHRDYNTFKAVTDFIRASNNGNSSNE